MNRVQFISVAFAVASWGGPIVAAAEEAPNGQVEYVGAYENVESASSEPDRTVRACSTIQGAATLLDHDVVLVGELHGTVEVPAFVADLACLALAQGKSVRIGLEISGDEATRLASYLDSPGLKDDREALLAGAPWQSPIQYGVTSRAMLDLIERVRVLKWQGNPIGLSLFNRTEGTSSKKRDRLMSETLASQIEATVADLFVVLTGNIHSRLARGTGFDPEYEPMGYLMRHAHPEWDLVSIDLSHAGGSAWICTGGGPEDCGELQQGPRQDGQPDGLTVNLRSDVQPFGHHGTYHVGGISASPPAVKAR